MPLYPTYVHLSTQSGGRVPKKIAGLDPVEEISCADKARLITGLRHHHKLTDLLKVAGLARSTFYYQCQAAQRVDRQSSMEVRIRAIYDEHKGRYGYRRITAALCSSALPPGSATRRFRALGLNRNGSG
ncbi:transposase [Ramlibacter sp. AW1]|uniref:Transposase n=1 Tax=Ramlibacter aurantiacus TaxID=2801330 RepID=A0A936ZJJ7_9BURK|nr:transposase [Ramlibacter aurantiacus]